MEKKKNDFIAQGSILAIASILVRVMGMIYRIPMTAIIGETDFIRMRTAFTQFYCCCPHTVFRLPCQRWFLQRHNWVSGAM